MPPFRVSQLSTFHVFATFLAVELKYVALNDSLYRYLSECRSDVGDPVLAELRAATDALGDISRMQISGSRVCSCKSLCCSAQGAPSKWYIHGLQLPLYRSRAAVRWAAHLRRCQREWTDIAQKYWSKAGVRERIELRLGSAIPVLKALEPKLTFDFALSMPPSRIRSLL